MQVKSAGPYTVTTGISHGKEYVYVTHNETGRQWISKSPYEGQNLEFTAENVRLGITKFYPDRMVASCDTRFWMPVKAPVPRNEFDALCFVGD